MERTQLSLVEAFAARAAADPSRPALGDGRRSLTYGELDAVGAAIAAGLLAAGVEAEEPVAVCLPRSWEAVAAFLGALRAGAAYVPVNPEHPPLRQRELVELSGARVALTARPHGDGLPAELNRLDVHVLAAGDPPGDLSLPPGGDRLAYVLFTSGSSGLPKGVEITHGNLMHVLRSGSDYVAREDDCVLQVAPLDFDMSASEIWGALLNGGRLVIAPPGRPDPFALGRLIAEREVTFLNPAAGIFHELVRSVLPQLGGVRLIATGADVVSPAVVRALHEAHPAVRVLNGWGPTEATIFATTYEVNGDPGDGPLPIGRPIPGALVYVLDEERREVPEGEAGEICIGGPGVGRGYRGDPELTTERFVPNPFSSGRLYRTGDRGAWRTDGELMFLGRSDRQVKVSGHRLELGEVEHALAAHPGVSAAAVVAVSSAAGRKSLVAHVVPPERPGPGVAELRAFLGERLPRYMVPASFEIVEALPLTERGKLDREALARAGVARPEAAGRAHGATVERVSGLMAELLELDSVGPDENLFELGGDSLMAISLLGVLRAGLGVELSVDTVFDSPTPAALADRIELLPAARDDRPVLARRARGRQAPLSFAQRRAWLFGQMHPDSIAYQFAATFGFSGELDTGALAGALAELLSRHEILRTSFVQREDEPVQVVHDEVALPLKEVDLRGEDADALERLIEDRVRVRIEPERAPLVRWTLARHGEREWTLVHVEHHLVHDGWSFTVLTRELSELYSARVEARSPLLSQPELGFGDYALWERELAASAGVAEQIGHWERTLDPDAPPIELPMARPRGAVESFGGSSIRRRMEAPAPAALAGAARAEGATTFMASFAAFAALLHRHSGREDLQIGSGLANRGEPAARDLIGMTVNTVVLRLDLGGDPTVSELLRRVRRVALEAYANADAPFDAVVDALAPPRDPNRSPLVNALFSFHDAPRGEHRWTGLDVEMVEALSNGTAKADLNVVAQDAHDGEITFVWEHSDLFDDADIELLAEQHIGLMEQFASRPQARLSELSLAGGEEVSAAREPRISPEHVVSGPATPYERESSIVDVFRDSARERPDAVALDLEGQRLTYAELDDRSDRLARALVGAGARPESRVGVLARRSLDTYAALLAVLKAGAAYVALEPDWPEARVAALAVDAGLELVLAEERLRRRLPPGCETIALDGSPPDAEAELPAAISPEAAAYVGYTSGSTGQPKGVEVPHRAVVRLVRGQDWIRLGPDEALLAAAPLAFDASTFEVWGALLNGSRLAVFPPEPLTADALDEVVRRQRVTTLWLPAGLFHRFVDLELDTLRAVDQLIAGGDVLSPEHVRRALKLMRPDAVLINGYGPTEATTFTCVHRLDGPGTLDGGAVPIGRPLANTRVVVVDDAGRSLPPGATGELWIGGDGVASGYLGDPALSAGRFVADPLGDGRLYRTGDLARIGAGGAIEFLGRRDRQLKIRGHRVEPAEVERVLAAHPDVAEAAVEPEADAEGQARLVAHYSTRSGEGDWRALRAWVSAQLPAAFVPARWNELERLPLNANGKVDRARLASLAATPQREPSRAGRREDPLEDRLCAAWAAVLELDSVAPDDDFFELGGHSLLAVSLFGEIERRTGVELPLATLFSAPTPAAIAERIAAGGWRESWEPLVPLKASGDLPPFFCVTAGDGNAVGFAALARRLSERQPFYALQVPGLDGRCRIPATVEAMAERYLREVRRVAPDGPFLLGGRCLGTKVALEMAQRLVAAGERVPLLAILDDLEGPAAMDAELPGGIPYGEVLSRLRERARREGVALGDVARPEGGAALLAYAREPVAGGVPRLLHHVWLERPEVREAYPEIENGDGPRLVDWAWEYGREQLDLPEQLLPPPSTPRLTRRRRKRSREGGAALRGLAAGVAERIDVAARGRLPGARERREARLRRITRSANASYRARPYPGRIVHLASAERASELSARRWHDIARDGVEEHVLDSTHRSMLRAPGVATLAARLDECIETALR
jgi:amino acid adenylation domain-containing protein